MQSSRIYSPELDSAAQAVVRWLTESDSAERVLEWYRQAGFAVNSLDDVAGLPASVVEERVSRLRGHWRRWLYGESLATALMGPFGPVAGMPFLGLVVWAWSIQMGFAYGVDVSDPLRQDDLRRILYQHLGRALGLPIEARGRHGALIRLAATALFWGFGVELRAADAVMAHIRTLYRAEWERAAYCSPPSKNHSPQNSRCSR